MHLQRFTQGRIFSAVSILLFSWCVAQAQSPPSIQFFLPGGKFPSRQLRFLLRLPDGRIQRLFTDDNGKFVLTGDFVAGRDYNLDVDSDKRTFERTTLRLRIPQGAISYLPVFLRPMATDALPKDSLDIAEYDAKTPPEARAAYEEAKKRASEGKTDEAISEFGRALVLHPQYLRVLNELGVLYFRINRLDDAVAAFRQAVSLNARYHPPLLNLALIHYRQGNFGESVILFNRLLEEQPALSAERVKYAEALIATGQLDEAEQQLREALKDTKLGLADRTNAHMRLGLKLGQDERYSAAIAELEKAVALSSDSASAKLYLGIMLAQLNKTSDAERELLKAYQLGGKAVATAQLWLGQIYYSQQKYEPSLKAFEQFLVDEPTGPNAANAQKIVEELKALLKK